MLEVYEPRIPIRCDSAWAATDSCFYASGRRFSCNSGAGEPKGCDRDLLLHDKRSPGNGKRIAEAIVLTIQDEEFFDTFLHGEYEAVIFYE